MICVTSLTIAGSIGSPGQLLIAVRLFAGENSWGGDTTTGIMTHTMGASWMTVNTKTRRSIWKPARNKSGPLAKPSNLRQRRRLVTINEAVQPVRHDASGYCDENNICPKTDLACSKAYRPSRTIAMPMQATIIKPTSLGLSEGLWTWLNVAFTRIRTWFPPQEGHWYTWPTREVLLSTVAAAHSIPVRINCICENHAREDTRQADRQVGYKQANKYRIGYRY